MLGQQHLDVRAALSRLVSASRLPYFGLLFRFLLRHNRQVAGRGALGTLQIRSGYPEEDVVIAEMRRHDRAHKLKQCRRGRWCLSSSPGSLTLCNSATAAR
jgi:hypothetical protein